MKEKKEKVMAAMSPKKFLRDLTGQAGGFQKKKIRIMVAMSGGVDSSVAAALLKKQGYDVIGIFMRFWADNGLQQSRAINKCCSFEAYSDARRVAQKIGIPIYTLDMKVPFKKLVVDYFLREYQAGRTPNPCVECNRFIKFGELVKKARAMGADYIATGHYARVSEVKSQKSKVKSAGQNSKVAYKLLNGRDAQKNQSYFLYTLDQEKLKHVLFPVGGYTKSRVRQMAKKLDLPVHAKKDSQEVCFVGANLKIFLKKYLKAKDGKITEQESGKTLGNHDGLPFYTVGQRKGIHLSGGPWYVVKIDVKKNVILVSRDEKKLLSKEISVTKVNWISGVVPKLPLRTKVRIRYRHKEVPATIKKIKNNYKIIFAKPQRAVTPGQSAVFYRGEEVLGGGIIGVSGI